MTTPAQQGIEAARMEGMATKHTPTPTPWATGIQGDIFKDGYGDIANCTNSNAHANAAHIVRCVNSHEALVEALEILSNWDFTPFLQECEKPAYAANIVKAREALALAKGE